MGNTNGTENGNNVDKQVTGGADAMWCSSMRQKRKIDRNGPKRPDKRQRKELEAYDEMLNNNKKNQQNDKQAKVIRAQYMDRLGLASLENQNNVNGPNTNSGNFEETPSSQQSYSTFQEDDSSNYTSMEDMQMAKKENRVRQFKNDKVRVQKDPQSPAGSSRVTLTFGTEIESQTDKQRQTQLHNYNLQRISLKNQSDNRRSNIQELSANNGLLSSEIAIQKKHSFDETQNTMLQQQQRQFQSLVSGKSEVSSPQAKANKLIQQSSNGEIETDSQRTTELETQQLFSHLSHLSAISAEQPQMERPVHEDDQGYRLSIIDEAYGLDNLSDQKLKKSVSNIGPKRISKIGRRLNQSPTFGDDPSENENQSVRTEQQMIQQAQNRKTAHLEENSTQQRVRTARAGSVQSGLPRRFQQSTTSSTMLSDATSNRTNRSVSKTNQEIRASLLSRLTYNKIWLTPSQRPKNHQTCIIFDWDDTILCTTFLAPHQQMIYRPELKFPPNLQKKIDELDDQAAKLVKQSKEFGKVYIVTNAAEGWVELSAMKFMPKVFEELKQDITIISARSRYEKLYPKNYQKWKIHAFLETQADMERDAITNLVALGDNVFEIEAAYILGAQYKSAFIKTVKFRQSPSTSELIKQIKLVQSQFELICTSPKNLTVRLLKQTKQEEEQQIKAAKEQQCDAGTAASLNMMSNYKKAVTQNANAVAEMANKTTSPSISPKANATPTNK